MNNSHESRPAVSHEAAKSFGGDSPDSTYLHRKSWSRALINKATRPIQPYGSPEWCALPLDDPNRIAAVILAAESWAWDYENLEENLRREVEGLRLGHKREEDRAYVESAAAHRRKFGGMTVGRSFEQRRAAQLEAAKPRPGDFPGRKGGGVA